MHELAMCRAIATTVAARAEGRPVTSVRLRVGHLRQVVPDTLAYCWGLHTRNTALDGSRLEVDHVPAAVRCRRCGSGTALDAPILRCSGCGSSEVDLVSGQELLIDSIELARDPAGRGGHEEPAG